MSIKHLIILLVLLSSFACNKRLVQQSKSSIDSSSVTAIRSINIDTTRSGRYTRITTFLPELILKNSIKEDIYDQNDQSTWPIDVFVDYLKALPDSVKRYPFIYESYSHTQKGLSTTNVEHIEREFSQSVKEKEVYKKSSTPWVFGLFLTILGIFLVIWIVPRKK